MFSWLFVVLIVVFNSVGANQIVGDPLVSCTPTEVVVQAKSLDEFEGVVFIRNWRKVDVCFADFLPSINATKEPKFRILLSDLSKCGLELKKTAEGNTELFFVLTFSFHPNFMTTNDRTFTIWCNYSPQSMAISFQLDEVPDITTKATFDGVAVAPSLLFKVVAGSEPNEQLNSVQRVFVGDPLTLTWKFEDESEIYGFRVVECTADGREIIVNDCSTDPDLITHVQYVENKREAFSNTTAFKLPDTESLWIKCELELCIKPHEYLRVDDKLSNAICKKPDCTQRQKKRSIDLNEQVIVLDNKILVLDSYKNVRQNLTEHNSMPRVTPKNDWCVMKSVFSAIVAFIGTVYTAALISIFVLYKITRNRLDYK